MAAREDNIEAYEMEDEKYDQTGPNLCRTGKVIQKIPFKPFVILKFRDAFTIREVQRSSRYPDTQ